MRTPRATAPVFSREHFALFPSGGRRAIRVIDADSSATRLTAANPMWFFTDEAILFGTPSDPCVDSISASATGPRTNPSAKARPNAAAQHRG